MPVWDSSAPQQWRLTHRRKVSGGTGWAGLKSGKESSLRGPPPFKELLAPKNPTLQMRNSLLGTFSLFQTFTEPAKPPSRKGTPQLLGDAHFLQNISCFTSGTPLLSEPLFHLLKEPAILPSQNISLPTPQFPKGTSISSRNLHFPTEHPQFLPLLWTPTSVLADVPQARPGPASPLGYSKERRCSSR